MKKSYLILILAFVLLSSLANASLTNGLKAYWSFDNTKFDNNNFRNNTNVRNLYNNSAEGDTGQVTGLRGQAVYLEGHCSGTCDGGQLNATRFGFLNWTDTWTISYWVQAKGDLTGDKAVWSNSFGLSHRIGGSFSGAEIDTAYYDGGSWTAKSCTVPSINNWYHIVSVNDGSGFRMYINDSACSGSAVGNIGTGTQFNIGYDNYAEEGNIYIDDFLIWDRNLSTAEVTTIYNGGVAYDWFAPAVITPVADLIFRNSSDDITTSFDEGEDFTTYLNYTLSNGSVVTNDTASCNISFVDGIAEDSAANTNFTICNTGCDFITYTEELDLHDTTNAVTDFARFNACHEQTLIGDIDVTFACGALTNTTTIDSNDFPLCSIGTSRLTVYDTTCIGSDNINISVSATVPNSQRKRVTDLEVDREFSLHTETALFNLTSSLWYISLTHEYYEHGNKTIYANCTEPTYSINHSEEITIVNVAPRIVFSGVRTSLGFTTGANNMVIEYANGIWNWSGTVTDNDLDHFNVSIYNSTGGLMINWTDLTNNTVLQTPDEMFNDFSIGNPYSINVTAIDTQNATTNLSAFFYVNDTTAPSCDFSNTTQLKDTTYSFDNTCTDEHFYSLNVTCDNSFSFFVDGLNVQSYNFLNSTNISTSVVTCETRYCDAHTAAELTKDLTLTPIIDPKSPDATIEIIDAGTKTAELKLVNGGLTTEIKTDRISFTATFTDLTKEYQTIFWDVSESSYYFEDDKYLGWTVDTASERWLDLNHIGKSPVEVIQHDGGLWEYRIFTKDKTVTFNSFGELNCVNQTFTITPVDPTLSCSYNPTPYLRQGIGINERDLNPVLCNITDVTGKTLKCTSTITFNGSLVQTNPEPLEYKDGIGSLIYNTRTIGYFTAKPEQNMSQNILVYFTNKKLQAERSATLSVNCFDGSGILNWNASITPTYKDMFTTMDTAIQIGNKPIYYIFCILFFGGIIGLLLWLINKAKQLKNGTY